MSGQNVRYIVFDIESVADGNLISKTRYTEDGLSAEQAIERFRSELLEKYDSDFIPYTFQLPIAIVAAKVGPDFRLIDLVSIDHPQYRPHVIVKHFWVGWEGYNKPTLVTFNGRTFDIPLLELASYRYGISVPEWFNMGARSYEQARNRYNIEAHLDLQDVLTNFGATRFTGGLNLAATMIGKPGKMDIYGHMVQDMFNEGRYKDIADYCRCDVLDTYFVFLRSAVMLGQLQIEREMEIVEETKAWLRDRVEETPIYGDYLDKCREWKNPWIDFGEKNELMNE